MEGSGSVPLTNGSTVDPGGPKTCRFSGSGKMILVYFLWHLLLFIIHSLFQVCWEIYRTKKCHLRAKRGYRQIKKCLWWPGANMCPYRHFIQIFEKMCGCLAKTWVTWVHIPLSWDTFCLTSFFHGQELSFLRIYLFLLDTRNRGLIVFQCIRFTCFYAYVYADPGFEAVRLLRRRIQVFSGARIRI